MHANSRPVLLASKMPASNLDVCPGERSSLVCPECQTWRILRRGMVFPHRAGDGATRCPGSGRRVRIDVPLARLETRQLAELAEFSQRRATRVQLKPVAPVAPPVYRLATR
jgi:hypothetical protein